MWDSGYSSHNYYHSSPALKEAVDRLYKPIGGESFSSIAEYLIGYGQMIADPFMCLADFDSYISVYDKAIYDYTDPIQRARRSLVNISKSGIFSSDNSIRKYASTIWNIKPIKQIEFVKQK